jgi:thiol-disulfide isomerase/thioredoxin
MKARRKFIIFAVVAVLAIPIAYKLANRLIKAYAEYDSSQVKDRGAAPELINDQWFNASAPIRLADMRGKVVMLDFWRIGCAECIHSLPYLQNVYARYKDKGVELVSIHSPELNFEYDVNNVRDFIRAQGIQYPVAIDNDRITWKGYQLRAWPTFVLIDKQGRIRYVHIGEGRFEQVDAALKELLAE